MAKYSWWWAERLPETSRVVIPIKLEFGASVGFIHKERSTTFATHLKHYKSCQCGALHRLPTATRDTSSNGLASKNTTPTTSEMSSGSAQTLVTRINKQNEDKGKRNRKNKFGDNRGTAPNMAAVAIPSKYIITKRFWSWDTQRQEYKKHVSLPQGPTMQLVSVPVKPSTHGFSFASAYRCILHKHLPFARRAVVIQLQTTNNLAATYARCRRWNSHHPE